MDTKQPTAHIEIGTHLVASFNVREINEKRSLLLPSTLLQWVMTCRSLVLRKKNCFCL